MFSIYLLLTEACIDSNENNESCNESENNPGPSTTWFCSFLIFLGYFKITLGLCFVLFHFLKYFRELSRDSSVIFLQSEHGCCMSFFSLQVVMDVLLLGCFPFDLGEIIKFNVFFSLFCISSLFLPWFSNIRLNEIFKVFACLDGKLVSLNSISINIFCCSIVFILLSFVFDLELTPECLAGFEV